MKLIGLVTGLAALLSAGPAAADLKQTNGDVCFEVMIIGTVKAYGEFASLDELFGPPEDGALNIGGRQEMTVRVDEVLGDAHLASTLSIRAMMTSAYVLPVQMLFYLQREERGSYWAADWVRIERDPRGEIDTPDQPPPRCPA